ncbi:hypothetical protein PoB_003608500 [Plakobranchus ocellatus]|uniref:Uncharacterized protein n=1 Tax=Plakobranchus ocellatus TaxID=259542 RepID=A0AAV4AMY3_9GAST|nr:hypothetical protein PoB_003608500 [Plakobranchus ocellatus]
MLALKICPTGCLLLLLQVTVHPAESTNEKDADMDLDIEKTLQKKLTLALTAFSVEVTLPSQNVNNTWWLVMGHDLKTSPGTQVLNLSAKEVDSSCLFF